MKLTMNASPVNGRLKYSYSDFLDVLNPANFEAIDFMLNDLVFDDSEMTLSDTAAYCENIRSETEKRGLTIEQTHAPFQFKKWDDKEHFENIIFPRMVRSLEMSARLGAKISVIHPLHYKPYKGNEEELFNVNMAYYRRLIPYCKEYGVKVGIENMWCRDKIRRYILQDTCNTAAELVRYVDTLDSEYMVANLDLGHVVLPEDGDTIGDFIRTLGHDRLKALHVHDNDYISDAHLLPYLGIIDWTEVTQALADINYDGNLTFEVTPSLLNTTDAGFTPIGAKFMSDVGHHLISEIERRKALK